MAINIRTSPIVLLTLNIIEREDVMVARQRAREISKLLHFDVHYQTRIATVVSEIARNAYDYAKGGKVEYLLIQGLIPRLVIRISDRGPGILHLDQILNKKLSEETTNSGGLIGSKKIMDKFSVTSEVGVGTIVVAEMFLQKNIPALTTQFLAKLLDKLIENRPKSFSEEVQQQNQELLQALNLLKKAKDELELRVNERTKQLEEAYRDLQEEIIERKRMEIWILNHQQNLAIAERINSMGEMASALSHELNSPLATITAYTQGCVRRLTSNDASKEEIIDAMGKVVQQSIRAGEILHRLKAFVNKGELLREYTDINQLIHETIILMQLEYEKNQIKISLDLDKHIPLILIDAIQIQQVLINLMRNALQAITSANIKKPTLFIQTILSEEPNKEAIISVLDNGPGCSVEDPLLLLEPYFTTKKEGMGMGLSISRTIVEAHGGTLIPKNNLKTGACFQFNLPIIIQDSVDEK